MQLELLDKLAGAYRVRGRADFEAIYVVVISVLIFLAKPVLPKAPFRAVSSLFMRSPGVMTSCRKWRATCGTPRALSLLFTFRWSFLIPCFILLHHGGEKGMVRGPKAL